MRSTFFLLLLLSALAGVSVAQVPKNNQFKYVNEGEFGPYINEYGADYRLTDLFTSPFHLSWYNTTPGVYYIGLRLGIQRNEPNYRWVWDLNRGRPVGEKATLSFGRDGNLVLAEADGRVVWTSNTANKGAVGLKLLPNGNIVIYDKKNNFLWQSFDIATDTLLVGQSLSFNTTRRLVSRKSDADNTDGIYSFELEKTGLNLYVRPPGRSAKLLRYSDDTFQLSNAENPIDKVTFEIEAVDEGAAYELRLNSRILTRPKYNATYSFLRLASDGNLEIYTYYIEVSWGPTQRTYRYLDEDEDVTRCGLPSRCGGLGVCEDEMCVACPTTKGLLGWSKTCKAPADGAACKGAAAVGYYKVEGVEHFITKFNAGVGKVKVADCKAKCSADCSCLGFFFHDESSLCWLAPLLGPLEKVSNSSHNAYIKF